MWHLTKATIIHSSWRPKAKPHWSTKPSVFRLKIAIVAKIVQMERYNFRPIMNVVYWNERSWKIYTAMAASTPSSSISDLVNERLLSTSPRCSSLQWNAKPQDVDYESANWNLFWTRNTQVKRKCTNRMVTQLLNLLQQSEETYVSNNKQ